MRKTERWDVTERREAVAAARLLIDMAGAPDDAWQKQLIHNLSAALVLANPSGGKGVDQQAISAGLATCYDALDELEKQIATPSETGLTHPPGDEATGADMKSNLLELLVRKLRGFGVTLVGKDGRREGFSVGRGRSVALDDIVNTVAGPAAGMLPVFEGLPLRKLEDLRSRGYRITGYAIEGEATRGFITTGGFVGWHRPEPLEPDGGPEPQ